MSDKDSKVIQYKKGYRLFFQQILLEQLDFFLYSKSKNKKINLNLNFSLHRKLKGDYNSLCKR